MDTVIIIAEIVKDSRFYWSEKQNLAINWAMVSMMETSLLLLYLLLITSVAKLVMWVNWLHVSFIYLHMPHITPYSHKHIMLKAN